MATTTDPTTAADAYERFFAEKLWELVPSYHKHEDGIADRPGTLRAFIELCAEQAALLRRGHDRLWDDAFIDLCDDWAVPYIGDLVATRMVSALNKRGRRVDVAKTIYYRRRKGTPRVLEELIADITGWEGKVVESFRFLGRCWHRLDPALDERVAPAVGWADLRSVRRAEQADGPWDPFAHTADVGKSHGRNGRWNIPKVSFHLFRLAAITLRGVTPFARADAGTFTFDPSGRDAQLFIPRHRDAQYPWDEWESAAPWEVPAPMGCRILGHAEYLIDKVLIAALLAAGVPASAVAELGPVVGQLFPTEDALHDHLLTLTAPTVATLTAAGNFDRLRAGALIAVCGKAALWPHAVEVVPTPSAPGPSSPVRRERVAAAGLGDWTLTAANVDALVDPNRGRFKLLTPPAAPAGVRVTFAYGFGGSIGAGGYDRRGDVADVPDVVVPAAPPVGGLIDAATFPVDLGTGNLVGVVEIPDSATYGVTGNPSDVESLVVQAANFERPYVRLTGPWTFTAAAGVEATLVIEGLWIGASAAAAIVLEGAWKQVIVRHATLDPGGLTGDGATLPAVRIQVNGQIDELQIAASIAARVELGPAGVLDSVVVTDSILDARQATGIAVALPRGGLDLRRTTVLGGLRVERLYASEALITGAVRVTDTQSGCFRFSSAPPKSRLPHPYRWVHWNGGPVFASTRFGDAGYTWLADAAPDALRRGGEHDVEIGASSAVLNPIKEESLLKKIEEYLPFGLMPTFIRET
jgi:hypothetical protein